MFYVLIRLANPCGTFDNLQCEYCKITWWLASNLLVRIAFAWQSKRPILWWNGSNWCLFVVG